MCRQKLQNYQKEMCKVVQTDIATFASHTPECSEALHINFVMTSDTNTRYYFSEFVLLDIGSLSMEISVRVFLDFSWRVYIYMKQRSHQLVNL